MPLPRTLQHGVSCDCCTPAAAAQNLDEVAFAKSAAAAAQAGNFFRVKALIARNPAAVHDDGYGGACSGLCQGQKPAQVESGEHLPAAGLL